MTRTGYRLVVAAVAFSFAHHADHVLRGGEATGWPLTGSVNAFTYSLAVYPIIATGLFLSRRGRVGPRFWRLLSSGGALFVLAVHLGPASGDAVGDIPGGYSSPIAGILAVSVLVAFIAVLAFTAIYEDRLARREPRSRAAQQVGFPVWRIATRMPGWSRKQSGRDRGEGQERPVRSHTPTHEEKHHERVHEVHLYDR